MLKTAIQNLQAIGQYYEFSDVDVDRYRIDRALRQVMISAREVDPRNLDASAQTWVNLHLAYTHGYGVVAAQVNRAETSGRPDLVVSGFDQQQAAIPVRQPRIYFGEPPPDTPTYVVVGSRQPEVDSPSVSGQGQTSFRYDGHGGVQLSSPLRRLAAALHFTDLNLLISSNLNGRSRILFNRDIRDRMEKAAPFLQWDADPYVAVVDGRVVFIRDGYTTTDNYPYSQRIPLDVAARRTDPEDQGVHGEANYIRNSVKAVVDAYDGTTTLYAFDETDPLLRAWRKAFPNLFAPRSAMTAGPAGAPALSGGPVLHPDRPLRLLPHRRRPRLLLQAGLLGPPRGPLRPTHPRPGLAGGGRPQAPDATLLPAHQAAGRTRRAVRAGDAVHPQQQAEHGGLHGRPVRPYRLRQDHAVQPPQGADGVRPHPDPRPDPGRPRGLQGTHPVQPAGLHSHPRQPADRADQGLAAVCAADLRPGQPGGNPGAATSPGVLQQPTRLHRQPDRLDRPSAGPDRQGPTDGRPPTTASPQAPSTALARILQQQAEEYRRAQQALDRHDLGAYQKAIERLGQLIQQAQQLTQAPSPSTTAQAASPP